MQPSTFQIYTNKVPETTTQNKLIKGTCLTVNVCLL